MTEADLVAQIKQRAAGHPSLVVGIGDDAAVLRPEPGMELVATTDTLVEGVHFDPRFSAADIGHLALAASLSDLAAMAARPRWVLLSLTLPAVDPPWIDGFLDGFLALAAAEQVILAGGNLARGPRNITVQALGEVAPGRAVTRRGARSGDLIVVTGTPGDAAAALALGATAPDALKRRLTRPQPRLAAGQALAPDARAMLDLSDGLLADLGRLLAPPLGARIELSALPASAALNTAAPDAPTRWHWQLGGGSDYELLAVLPPACRARLPELAARAGVALTEIGVCDDRGAIVCRCPDGAIWDRAPAGWDHFRGPAAPLS